MKPLPAEQVQQTAQIVLAFLEMPSTAVPGNLTDGIVSGKSLLRGLISGVLVICQTGTAEPPLPPDDPPPATSPAATGPGKKKKAKKKGKTKP